jgi:hypothetical protein
MRRGLAPAALVIAVATATWLISGVAAFDIIRFLGYEIGFVLLPGSAVLWALRGRRPGALMAVALGWPLGYTMEILAFSATAAIGSRALFLAYPIVALVGSALFISRHSGGGRGEPIPDEMSARLLWTAAAALSLGLIYLALGFLSTVPLPSQTVSVRYDPDYPYFIGLIAEALHHWPPGSPGLSGSPLHYEWFVFLHMAAASQVTHLAISTLALRLDYVPFMVVIACQLLAVGRLLGRGAWTGVVAIMVVFLLGALDLTTDSSSGPTPFVDRFNYHLWASWTFPFGLMFFLALLYLISERLQAPTRRTRGDFRAWTLIALLMVGASGAKATILPVVITGTGLYAVYALLIRKELPRVAVVTLVLAIAVFIVTFFVVYGGGVPGTVIQPLVWLTGTAPVIFAKGIHSHTIRIVAVPLAYAVGLAGVLLPLAGIFYLLRRRHRGEIPPFTLCICMFVGGVLISGLVHQLSGSEEYFLDTGYVAGCIVAAAGLRLAWLDAGRALPVSKRAAVTAVTAWVALLVLIVVATSRAVAHPDALAVRYVGLAVGCGVFVLLWAGALWARHRSTSGILALALIPALAATALTSPVALSPTLRNVLTGAPITPAEPDPQTVSGLTPDLLAALRWVRDHSSVDAVFAVSNHWIYPGQWNGKYYYYSAFSERRVFIEAYDSIRYGITTGLATAAGVNFAYRQRLNDAVFNDADAAALGVLTRQYGVRLLFIDRIHRNANPKVLQLGHVVFSNSDATIVAVG